MRNWRMESVYVFEFWTEKPLKSVIYENKLLLAINFVFEREQWKQSHMCVYKYWEEMGFLKMTYGKKVRGGGG